MTGEAGFFSWAIRSDVGRVRETNQDMAYAESPLFVVADGMGGHSGGEVASEIAVRVLSDEVPVAFAPGDLQERIRLANSAIMARAESDTGLTGMGTTLCALGLLEGDAGGVIRLELVNVGDSRIYRFAEGELQQVSEDHSLVGELLRAGHLTAEEAVLHPQRNIVTRALGLSPQVDVDHWELSAHLGEQFLLCSDGLVDEVTDAQIAATFFRFKDPGQVADQLVSLANQSGARDNVTVVVVQIEGGELGPADVLPVTPLVNPVGGADDAATELSMIELEKEPFALGSEDNLRTKRWFSKRKRVFAFVVVFVAIVSVITVLIGVYARDNYYIDFDNDQVVIYQGRPGGILWFGPTLEEPTPLLRSDLSVALEKEIESTPEFDSLKEAETYIDALEARSKEDSLKG